MSTQSTPLDTVFQDDWYKFTENTMDAATVSEILGSRFSPSNSPHATTVATLGQACDGFMQENGGALIKALEHLKKH